jgi:hypothetical protein
MIRDGAFLFSVVAPSRGVAQWLGAALASPMGRIALLDADARKIAVGAFVPDAAEALAAMVASYKFHEDDDHEDDIQRLFGRIQRARDRMGLPPPKRLGPLRRCASRSRRCAPASCIRRRRSTT